MTEETIFQEALARSAADRARFLDEACSGQPNSGLPSSASGRP